MENSFSSGSSSIKFAKEFPYPEDLMKVKRSLTLIESHTSQLFCLPKMYLRYSSGLTVNFPSAEIHSYFFILVTL